MHLCEERDFFRTTYPKYWRATEKLRSANAVHRSYQDASLSRLRLRPDLRILEAGCGSGELMYKVERSQPGLHVVGVDLGLASLEDARRRLDKAVFAQSDLCSLPFPEHTFDVVYCSSVLWYVESPCVAIRELVRVTRPGGAFLFDVRNRWHVSAILAAWMVGIRRLLGSKQPRYHLISLRRLEHLVASLPVAAQVEGFFAVAPTRFPLLDGLFQGKGTKRRGAMSRLQRLTFGPYQGRMRPFCEKLLTTGRKQ